MDISIRKITVGGNYTEKVLHYQIGSYIKLKDGLRFPISKIEEEVDEVSKIKVYSIYIKANSKEQVWKKVIGVPVTIEYNIVY